MLDLAAIVFLICVVATSVYGGIVFAAEQFLDNRREELYPEFEDDAMRDTQPLGKVER